MMRESDAAEIEFPCCYRLSHCSLFTHCARKDLSTMTEQTEEKPLTQAAKMLQSVAKPLVEAISFLLPPLIVMTGKAWKAYKKLPQNVARFLTGFVFCFFGGLYPTLFAAIQAAEHGGRKVVVAALSDLADEAMGIIEESKKDDKADDNRDGVSDVQQMSNSEFVLRKTKLVVKKMNPEKVWYFFEVDKKGLRFMSSLLTCGLPSASRSPVRQGGCVSLQGLAFRRCRAYTAVCSHHIHGIDH